MVTLDALRGLASFAVAWFHFTNGNPAFLENGFLKTSGRYGWMGVEVFFVISGFVIPYALARAGFRLGDYPRFLAKRLVRLDPPYLIAIALSLAVAALAALAPGYRGAPFHVSAPQLLLHLGYLNVFFGYEWLNPVFWTLAVELQYYLLIGLAFPAIASTRWTRRIAVAAMFGTLALLFPSGAFLFHYLFLFLLGIATFQRRFGLLSDRGYLAHIAVYAAGAGVTLDPWVAVLAACSALVIAYGRTGGGPLLRWLGTISYSLYLVHVPIGGRVINLSLRFPHTLLVQCAALALAIGVSLVAAWVLYVTVERPAQRWAEGIRYRRAAAADVSPESRHAGATAPVFSTT